MGAELVETEGKRWLRVTGEGGGELGWVDLDTGDRVVTDVDGGDSVLVSMSAALAAWRVRERNGLNT